MTTCGCSCDKETMQCDQPDKINSECPVQWDMLKQNIHFRFLIQQEDLIYRINLFDQDVKKFVTISIRWDENKKMAIGSKTTNNEEQRYRKLVKSKSTSASEMGEIRNVALNFNGTYILVCPLWDENTSPPFAINYDSETYGTIMNVSFTKTMRHHGVRFNQPS